jgi:hypothetical protein
MPSKRQKIEKALWDMTKSFIEVPPSKDAAEYRATRRKIEKKIEDPAFIQGFQKQYLSFYDFLREHDITVADIRRLMGMDLSEFLKPRQQRRKR